MMLGEHGSPRSDFPYLAERTYLNTAAVGLTPSTTVRRSIALYEDALSRGMDAREVWLQKTDDLRGRLAAHLNVAKSEVSFAASTTSGLNAVSLSLDLAPDDHVLLLADDFISVRLAWDHVRETGGRVIELSPNAGQDRTRSLIEAMTPQTRIVAVSHVDPASGWMVDLDLLGAACELNDSLLIVDGVQALGAVPVDLSHVDVYVASCFKWLLSGFGIAVVVVGERATQMLKPRIRGYRNPAPSRELEFAHTNYAGVYALDSSLNYLHTIGFDRVYSAVRDLSAALWVGLVDLGYMPAAPLETRAGIVTMPTDQAERLVTELADRGVSAAGTVLGVRFSPHFYNSVHDIERALEIVRGLTVHE